MMKKKAILLYRNPKEFDDKIRKLRSKQKIANTITGVICLIFLLITIPSLFDLYPTILPIFVLLIILFLTVFYIITFKALSNLDQTEFQIDTEGIRIRYPLKNKVIPFDQIENLYIANMEHKDSRRKIIIILKSKRFFRKRVHLNENIFNEYCVPTEKLKKIFKIIVKQIEQS